ncbi:hypothetical protein Fot_38518 [Forsythia ovata]|uniref:Uncharacterized protein n=1 Tax=Forsythia ovata TaxID=205694 RepID=A0ABD1S2S6_9LAMI
MSRRFTDPARAEENFQILDQLKDTKNWKKNSSLLDPNTSSPQARSLQERHHTKIKILARLRPLLLGGIEEELIHLLEDDNEIMKEGVLHVLVEEPSENSWEFHRDLILERICIEDSRKQAKYVVYALASITKDDGVMSLSVL